MSQSFKDEAANRPATRSPLFEDAFPASVREALGESEQVLARDYRDGVERRIDAAHPFPTNLSEAGRDMPAETRPPVAEARQPAPAAPSEQNDDELFFQANHIAQQLRTQLGELDRRESFLTEQLQVLDQERRNVRNWVGQFEQDMVERANRIRTKETELSRKIAAAESLVQELREMERGARAVRDELAAERAQLRAHVEQEFAAQRAEIQQMRQALEEGRRILADQTEQNQREYDTAMLDCRRRLEEEWSRLSQKSAEALENEHIQLQMERATWIAERDAERRNLEQDAEKHRLLIDRETQEAILRREEEDSLARRLMQEEWEQLRAQATESLEKERVQHQLDMAAWATQRDAEQQRLQRDREQHEANLRREEDELDARRRQFEADLATQTKQHEERVAAELQKLAEERERTKVQEQQERAVFENRLRFQTEHLEKSREELETARNEFRREQQQARALNERTDALLRNHREQLDRFRELLEERERSIEREHDLLSRARRNFENESEGHRNKLKLEWEAFSQERQSQRAELRRQRDTLAVHADNLESRRARLDHLRAELEETHRSTLEMRLAVEEAWAKMSHAAGTDKARRQVEEARKAYADHFRHLHEQLVTHRDELADAVRALTKQKEEFTEERQSLATWISERDDALRLREEQLRRDADYLDVRESAWRAARDRWNHEKLSAEEIIRDLLRQLTHLNDIDRTARHDREPFPLNPLLARADLPAA